MTDTAAQARTARPARVVPQPVPPLPQVSDLPGETASTEYSHYRTKLSNHRTGLSEHRTDLSEYRTDLSDHRTDMSMRRTDMSFERTHMAAERTLMSIIRTALSLIGFGFTIHQAFERLKSAGVIEHAAAPRNFGLALISVGVLLLVGGIVNYARFGGRLQHVRQDMKSAGLIHAGIPFPVSVTFLCAVILLLIGLMAGASMLFNFSLFG